ncbi:HD-GYP domain-containing protein [Teredinibacter waterburyi]|jgi:HD-GYP domain|uniref:HD-GYP domain-containing protein n=1 Tax=Teredinibacter waterburyi TaxID=1500538 RepID=UPI00165FEBB6|nr:HD-GYP domain-containing protein [Teredinibacter waterburyi]
MSNTKKIHVGELRIGMYVSKLDREWLDTPFIMQGFLIEERDDIEIIAEFSDYVWIDSNYSAKASAHSSGVGSATSARSAPLPEVPLEDEHRKTYKTFRSARSLTKTLLDDVRLGGALDGEKARSMVNDCVQSVIRHPDALLWMTKIRNQQEYTAEHCLNVCILAIAFGRQLGLDEPELQNLGLCGMLHDVGKMRVPEEIVNKPAALTAKEYRLMKAHTVHGRNLLLSTSGIYSGVVDVAYSHHERIDGTGYPRKLPGHGISRFSRIIAIVDAYDAMTADRCYSHAKTSTEALKIIYNERGKHFDETLALKFIETIGLYPAGSLVELYSGEVGIVVEANPNLRHLPRIILLLDEEKNLRPKEMIKDLSLIEHGDLPRKYLIKQVWRDGSFGISLREYQKKGLVLKM